MRMRKKKWAEPYLEEHSDFIFSDPVGYAGQWKKIIPGKLLHVEIGMGKGDYLNGMAELYPEDCWVGIERERSVAAVACKKALNSDNLNINNKRMIVGNAENITCWFGENEIDVIHLNFSDPWPKKSTHKRRLSSEKFLEMYKVVLKNHGEIRMKTDNRDFFEDSVLYLLNAGFKLKEFSVDFRRKEHPEDVITEYENRFMSLGQPIYQLAAEIEK